MSWTSDYLADGFRINAADMQSLQNALYERLRAYDNSAAADFYADSESSPYRSMKLLYPPAGLVNPSPPSVTDIQSASWYQTMQVWIEYLFAGGPFFSADGTADTIAYRSDLPGFVKPGYDFNHAPLLAVDSLGEDSMYHGMEAGIFRTLTDARVAAGLSNYSAKPGVNADTVDAWRVRKPREIDYNGSDQAIEGFTVDVDNNVAIDGQRAWNVWGMLYECTHGTVTGRWKHIGQKAGAMPDLLDSESARPNYVTPRRHRAGDYLEGHLLHEMREIMKLAGRWANYIVNSIGDNNGAGKSYQNATAVAIKFGNSDEDPNWNTVKTNVDSSFAASVPYSSSEQLPSQSVTEIDNGLTFDNPHYYGATKTSISSRWFRTVPRPFSRYVNLYLAADKYFGSTFISRYGLTENQFRFFQLIVDPPESFVTDWLPAGPSPELPAWPNAGNPPPIGDGQSWGFRIPLGFYVADYSGGFHYT